MTLDKSYYKDIMTIDQVLLIDHVDFELMIEKQLLGIHYGDILTIYQDYHVELDLIK